MEISYLSDALEALEFQGQRIAGEGLGRRKVRLSLDRYSVFLLDRLAAHVQLEPAELGRQLLTAALMDAAGFFRGQLGPDMDREADEFLDAWDTLQEAQRRVNGLTWRWWRGDEQEGEEKPPQQE